ncbi:MAG: glycosyltransferase family 39 protein [Bacteroidota bacterium]
MKLKLAIKKRFSLIVVILLSTLISYTCLSQHLLNSLSWDVFAYYLYLPATFIYNDLGLHDRSWVDFTIQKYHTTDFFYQAHPAMNGNWVIKTPMGLAYFYAPFFMIGHIIAGMGGYAKDGFSAHYQVCMNIGMLFYSFVGLLYLRKIVLRYFDEMVSGLVIILIVLATNYFHLTADAGLMPHNILFMLVAMFIWYSIKWYENQKLKYAVFLGIISGLIIISRPNEIVCVLFLVFLANKNFKNISRTIKQIIFALIAFFITILPQLVYWKMTSGSFIYFSYQDPCQGFDFLEPYTVDFLFSFRKGWLVYTPIVIVMLLGLYYLYRKKRDLFWPIILYVIGAIYIVSSWSCWWYAGCCYSQRGIISLYVVLSIPLALIIEEIRNCKLLLKILFSSLMVALIFLNLFQRWQFNHGIIDQERMTRSYYLKVFGRSSINPTDKNMLLPQSRINEDTVRIDFTNFPKTEYSLSDLKLSKDFKPENYIIDKPLEGKTYYKMQTDKEFSPGFEISYKKIKSNYAWAKVSADIYFPDSVTTTCPFLVITTVHNEENCKYYTIRLPKDSVKTRTWIHVSKLYLTPDIRSRNDHLGVYFWNNDKVNFYISDFKVDLFEYSDLMAN